MEKQQCFSTFPQERPGSKDTKAYVKIDFEFAGSKIEVGEV